MLTLGKFAEVPLFVPEMGCRQDEINIKFKNNLHCDGRRNTLAGCPNVLSSKGRRASSCKDQRRLKSVRYGISAASTLQRRISTPNPSTVTQPSLPLAATLTQQRLQVRLQLSVESVHSDSAESSTLGRIRPH